MYLPTTDGVSTILVLRTFINLVLTKSFIYIVQRQIQRWKNEAVCIYARLIYRPGYPSSTNVGQRPDYYKRVMR